MKLKFNEFYKTLEEVVGVEELKKFPPENEIPCKKIFMLMTLSVKPTSKEKSITNFCNGRMNQTVIRHSSLKERGALGSQR